MSNNENSSTESISLGKHLETIRKDRGLSLRKVEEISKKEISNPYLSQIENDKIAQPSPHILHTLSELYGVDYMVLMQKAGYLKEANSRNDEERHARVATFSEINLTGDEEDELLNYLKYLRFKKSK